jgi:hypothetical protein
MVATALSGLQASRFVLRLAASQRCHSELEAPYSYGSTLIVSRKFQRKKEPGLDWRHEQTGFSIVDYKWQLLNKVGR